MHFFREFGWSLDMTLNIGYTVLYKIYYWVIKALRKRGL